MLLFKLPTLLTFLYALVHSWPYGYAQLHPKEPATYKRLPSLREQAKIINGWRAERRKEIPNLLAKHGIDAWIICQREHAEDTLWWSLQNATDYDVHRRTLLLFHTNSSSLAGQPNPLIWIDNTDTVWPELRSVLSQFDPQKIAINVDTDIAFASGLHVGELEALKEGLGPSLSAKLVPAPVMLGVEYVAKKVDGMLEYYKDMQEIVWAMLEEGFSERVIVPGVTSTVDLEWWFREKMLERNVSTWNHPSVSVITEVSLPGWSGTDDIIQEGDLLHIDMGITAMRMNTDTQHLAYVLRPGEIDAPAGYKQGLKKANTLQDILLQELKPGKTGNEVLNKTLEKMKKAGIEGQIYSHPIGDWGHDAGAVVGFTNLPKHVPVLGELPVLSNMWYSIELFAYHFVPERNATLRFLQEEDAYWNEDSQSWQFVRGRQEKFHLIRSEKRFSPGLRVQV